MKKYLLVFVVFVNFLDISNARSRLNENPTTTIASFPVDHCRIRFIEIDNEFEFVHHLMALLTTDTSLMDGYALAEHLNERSIAERDYARMLARYGLPLSTDPFAFIEFLRKQQDEALKSPACSEQQTAGHLALMISDNLQAVDGYLLNGGLDNDFYEFNKWFNQDGD